MLWNCDCEAFLIRIILIVIIIIMIMIVIVVMIMLSGLKEIQLYLFVILYIYLASFNRKYCGFSSLCFNKGDRDDWASDFVFKIFFVRIKGHYTENISNCLWFNDLPFYPESFEFLSILFHNDVIKFCYSVSFIIV